MLKEEEKDKAKEGEEGEEGQIEKATMATDILAEAGDSGPKKSTEFSDAEIEAAFRFIDLDKNGFIGAAEIRHILICMGELITDEEVDMMIGMIDGDGDGQVSYREFYSLVTDPDPSRPDFGKQNVTDAKQVAGGNAASMHERQKEMMNREEKRRMLNMFVEDNGLGQGEIMFAFEQYENMPASSKKEDDSIDFDVFCKLLQVEPTGEYHRLFTLFDGDSNGTVDIKEMILGLCNLIDIDKDARCNFIFQMYDKDRSGFLSEEELIQILCANHMQSAKSVERKAKTIMKQADKDGSGELSLEEFQVVSQKFPNILFPAVPKDEPKGGAPPPPPAPPG